MNLNSSLITRRAKSMEQFEFAENWCYRSELMVHSSKEDMIAYEVLQYVVWIN
jgi:hypothetical protein